MKISRCEEQGSKSLKEYFLEGKSQLGYSTVEVIERLEALPDKRRLWGLTSVSQIKFFSTPKSEDSRACLKLTAGYDDYPYRLSCRVPDSIAPWPNAYIAEEIENIDELIEKFLLGMDWSQGW